MSTKNAVELWHEILAGKDAEIERLKAALSECARETYMDEHDLEFKPTRGAEIARAALTAANG